MHLFKIIFIVLVYCERFVGVSCIIKQFSNIFSNKTNIKTF